MNYPTGIKKEIDINSTNEYYINKKIAYIYKKPTPIKLVKVDYKKGEIKEAYFEKPSTTDYNGIYRGKYIDFEAKETINKLGFPLINIHKHQTYILRAKDFIRYIDNNNKKIIPLEYFKEYGYKIKDKFIPRVDYLEIINKLEDFKWEMMKWKIENLKGK